MSEHKQEKVRDAILETIEASLKAQLEAIKRLRNPNKSISKTSKSMSQIDMAYDILLKTAKPLHINEIIEKVKIIYQIQLDRESLVSAITKKIKRNDRFIKTGKNVFAAREDKVQ